MVENDIGVSNVCPTPRLLAIAMQEIQHRIFSLGAGIVAGRGVNVEIALIADDCRFVEVMMDNTVGYIAYFPW
jgi:hypothetical protein